MSNNIIVDYNGDVKRVPKILDQIEKYRFNPTGIQRVVLDYLRDVTEGTVDIVDPTNPFVFALESSAVSTAAFMTQNEVNTRRQYARVAQTPEDIFRHLSDKDFIDCFASPSSCKFSIMVPKEDLLAKMVTDPNTGIRKVVIPRNTTFTVAETVFSLQYPIEIRQYKHSGIQIVYNTDKPSPLQQLKTNNIDWELRRFADGAEWIYFEVETTQFSILSFESPVTPAQPFKREMEIDDSFYFIRVYNKKENSSNWVEIYTTHTDQVYDPFRPTAVTQVIDKKVKIFIPQIYLNSGLVDGTLRVDIYQTKGNVNLIMENYPISAFEYRWHSVDDADKDVYTSAFTVINPVIVYSTQIATGGKNALDFNTLRDRVINNTVGSQDIPITSVEISTALDKKGYQIVKNIDLVTNRVFLATKQLPVPLNEKLITAAAATMETFVTTIESIRTQEGVYANGTRTTISPSLIYQNEAGIIKPFPKQQLDSLMTRTLDDIADYVSSHNFLYTPFHYVLDTSNNNFSVRPYYLDKPQIESLVFEEQNDSLELQVNTQEREFVRTPTGYVLRIVTKSNDAYKAIAPSKQHVVLSYTPPNEVDRAYIVGSFVSLTDKGERVYEFDLSTNFDIDDQDNIHLEKFFIYTTDARLVKTPLVQSFDIMYYVETIAPVGYAPIQIDKEIPSFLITSLILGVTQERIRLSFGKRLFNLWSRSRSVVEAAPLKRYTVDVPWLYDKDVYQVDPVTGSKITINPDGSVSYNLLHAAGTPILDEQGKPTYRFRVGDVMLNEYGQPIPEDENKVARQFDMFFIEGAYYFANDTISKQYNETVVDTVVQWITEDLASISKSLLERTFIYFYPKSSIGKIEAMVNDGTVTYLDASQSFKITLYVNSSVYQNVDLRDSLRAMTVKTFDNYLKQQTISMSAITAALKDVYGQDVISFSTTGLGGLNNYSTLTVLNNEDRCSIKKRLIKLSDDKLIVQEDIEVEFVRHEI